MADFQTCFLWGMHSEDPLFQYAIVPDPPDIYQVDAHGQNVLGDDGEPVRIGAYAISGINSAKHPDEYQIIAGVPQSHRGSWVQAFYEANYWCGSLETLISDEVAKREYDMAINEGRTAAAKNLQMAVAACGHSVNLDGVLGPATVAAANACDEAQLVDAIRAANAQHYRDIVAKDPSKAKYLAGWLARAAR